MKQLIIKAALVSLLGIVGCSDNLSLLSAQSLDQTGGATLTVDVAQVGILAKVSQFEMEELVVTLTAEGEEDIVKKIEVSTRGGDDVVADFNGLASFKSWTVVAYTIDNEGVVIHRGGTSFYVEPEKMTEVVLDLEASYSGLIATVSELPDSVTSFSLIVDGIVVDVVEKGKPLVLSYDYLTVDDAHSIVLVAQGVMWGAVMDLYEGSVTVEPKSGVDQGYTLHMAWVGAEEPPAGAGILEINIGTVGTESIKTTFEKHTIKYKAEQKEKKEKK
ncbi:MAG: hypothetical protein OCC49_07320 [Fibrobacterales bacterium]